MNKNKITILFSCFICILLFQNCGPGSFEANLSGSETAASKGTTVSDPAPEPQLETPAPSDNNVVPESSEPENPSTPPVVTTTVEFTDLLVSMNSENQVIVSWKQSPAGTGQVSFGTNSSSLSKKTDKENSDLPAHRQMIREDLEINHKYYFQVTTVVNGKSFTSKTISLNYEPKETPPETLPPDQATNNGDISTHCNPDKPLCGIMYGVAISGETYGHTTQYKHSAAMKFQAEKSGLLKSFTYHNRVYRKSEWDQDDGKGYNPKYGCQNKDLDCKMKRMRIGGYHSGNGGLLSFYIHADNGQGEPKENFLARGKTKLVPTGNKHRVGTYEGVVYYVGDNSYDKIEWDRDVNLKLGNYYHLVIRQEQPDKGRVVLNGFYAHNPGTTPESAPGGPYYGRRVTTAIKQSSTGAWRPALKVFPDFKLQYADGTIAGPGNDGVGGEYARYTVQGNKMARQVFIMDYNEQMSGVWVRLNRKSGKSPLTITVKNGDGSVMTKVSSASSKVPNTYSSPVSGPVNWVYNKFSSPISFLKGRKYFIEFKTNSDTAYQLQTEETYDYQGGKKLSKESVWRGSENRAEYSTGGENAFKPVPRSVKDFSILFTVNGKPEVVK